LAEESLVSTSPTIAPPQDPKAKLELDGAGYECTVQDEEFTYQPIFGGGGGKDDANENAS